MVRGDEPSTEECGLLHVMVNPLRADSEHSCWVPHVLKLPCPTAYLATSVS